MTDDARHPDRPPSPNDALVVPPVGSTPVHTASAHRQTAETILDAWRAGKSPHTMRSYGQDLATFARFLSHELDAPLTVEAALEQLFRQDSASAHTAVLAFRASLLDANLAPASINRALATLRSISKLARMLGMVSGGWYLEVPGVKGERRRDTRGPAVDDIKRMLAATAGDTETGTRDAAIVTTLYCLGLRVSELCGLRLEETDLARATTWIRGKARRERELVPLPPAVVDALRRYLRHRGASGQGPLFVSRPRLRRQAGLFDDRDAHAPRRLHPRSVLRIVDTLGRRVGARVWCHALRHTAVTEAIVRGQQAGLGLDQIRAFSRHRTLATMLVYRDEHDRAGIQRQLADVVAGTLA
jgi:integrase/recombinase XerC